MLSKLKNIGPGALVAAAFIGPGTVTTCTLAGANFAYALIWALVFATVATIVLQEMAARLGAIAKMGLGEALNTIFAQSFWKWLLFALIIVAIYLGNAAYQAGNLSGAALGVEAVVGDHPYTYSIAVIVISLSASLLLWLGTYKHIERMLIALVSVMAAAFIFTFITVKPDLFAITKAIATPQIPSGSLMTVIALIGTTIVPYNLFLHAAAVKSRWSGEEGLKSARTDTTIAIGVGGLIAILIVSTASATIFGEGLKITNAGDMARQLEPTFGIYSRYVLSMGLLAAGLSSAITAPLATAYAMSEIMQLKGGIKSRAFRGISLSVILIGATIALTGIKPITIIISAQFANGLLLPIIAGFLLFVMNNRTFLGRHANGPIANIFGGIVLLVVTGLGIRLVAKATGFI